MGYLEHFQSINEYCVDQAIKTGLSLNAQINLKSIFDRKKLFLSGLPQGYQISQFEFPIVGSHSSQTETDEGLKEEIGITRDSSRARCWKKYP